MKFVVPITRYWWWLVLCGLLAAGVSHIILLLLPPIYQSEAQINLTFDHNRSLSWNDKSMLELSDSLGRFLYDPKTIQAVIEQTSLEGVEVTSSELSQMTDTRQRFYDWVLFVHSPSALESETVLQIWVNAAFENMLAEKNYLLTASTWNEKADLLVSCIQRLPVEPAHPSCCYGAETGLQSALLQAQIQVSESKIKVKLLNTSNPAFELRISQEPTPAELVPPAWFGMFLMASGLIGFIAGALLVQFKKIPQKFFKARQKTSL